MADENKELQKEIDYLNSELNRIDRKSIERFEQWLSEKQLSKRKLAGLIGESYGRFTNWPKEKPYPKDILLKVLLLDQSLSANWLFGLDDNKDQITQYKTALPAYENNDLLKRKLAEAQDVIIQLQNLVADLQKQQIEILLGDLSSVTQKDRIESLINKLTSTLGSLKKES